MRSRRWARGLVALAALAAGCQRWHLVGASSHGEAPFDAAPSPDRQPDLPSQAPPDAPVETPPQPPEPAPTGGSVLTHPRIYFTTIVDSFDTTDVVLIDVAAERAVADVTLNGAMALGKRGDAILAARTAKFSRISVLDPATLEVVGEVPLPFDPFDAVFSADGSFLYATRQEDGVVSQIRTADGVVTAMVAMPEPEGFVGTTNARWLALDGTETRLAVSAQHYGRPDGETSSVNVLAIAEGKLTPTNRWEAINYDPTCLRQAASVAFAGQNRVVAFDANCEDVDVFDLAKDALDPKLSVRFTRTLCVSGWLTTIFDGLGQIWTENCESLYRVRLGGGPDAAVEYPFGPGAGPLLLAPSGTTLYAFPFNPRVFGVNSIDARTGVVTPLGWDLDLVPANILAIRPLFVAPAASKP